MGGGGNKVLGRWGEDQACLFLTRHGFRIIERNFYATMGEIDIVAIKGDDYYFVEVKTRRDAALATDLAVTKPKLQKLKKTMKYYCYRHGIGDKALVVASLLVFLRTLEKTARFNFTVLY